MLRVAQSAYFEAKLEQLQSLTICQICLKQTSILVLLEFPSRQRRVEQPIQ